eukprot:TRINITY_DN26494_c0_g1_i1.p1 TRINITY_DN26494_c0_g1~~TRINITY_DN26494_c0_g1_i1.p1  ORF type:complete len:392 (-),score=106.98 TRINITY_DN26494_c0_g1_i1:199-1374(-)
MGERKVLNKYYPPDFDPAKIPRRKQPKNLQMKVRMMLPMSIRCNTCGNYIYMGTKFNCRKEDVVGETYLGILIFRFYFKCTKCSAELIMKTDPQNSDYVMEAGATRNFEPWREKDEVADQEKREREAEELGDAMKALENRTLASKQEMDITAALDEMKSMRSRQAALNSAALLHALKQTAAPLGATAGEAALELTEEDEELIKRMFPKTRRIADEEDDDGSLHFARPGEVGKGRKRNLAESPLSPTDILVDTSNSPGGEAPSLAADSKRLRGSDSEDLPLPAGSGGADGVLGSGGGGGGAKSQPPRPGLGSRLPPVLVVRAKGGERAKGEAASKAGVASMPRDAARAPRGGVEGAQVAAGGTTGAEFGSAAESSGGGLASLGAYASDESEE